MRRKDKKNGFLSTSTNTPKIQCPGELDLLKITAEFLIQCFVSGSYLHFSEIQIIEVCKLANTVSHIITGEYERSNAGNYICTFESYPMINEVKKLLETAFAHAGENAVCKQNEAYTSLKMPHCILLLLKDALIVRYVEVNKGSSALNYDQFRSHLNADLTITMRNTEQGIHGCFTPHVKISSKVFDALMLLKKFHISNRTCSK